MTAINGSPFLFLDFVAECRVWVRGCRSLTVSERPLFKVNQSFTGNNCLSPPGRYAKLCITAIMTSVLLCTVRCRERDAAWVRSINPARELCIIIAISRTGAGNPERDTGVPSYRDPEVWPVPVLSSTNRLRHTCTWFSSFHVPATTRSR